MNDVMYQTVYKTEDAMSILEAFADSNSACKGVISRIKDTIEAKCPLYLTKSMLKAINEGE